MRQIAWLGRTTRPSTAVSTRLPQRPAGRPVEGGRANISGSAKICPSAAGCPSLGTRGAAGGSVDGDCLWDVVAMGARPVSADELVTARNAMGREAATLLTGGAFTDTAVKSRDRPRRLPHHPFRHPRAGHGAPPRLPGPARARYLVRRRRSGRASTFQEIFDLKIDADLVDPRRATPPVRRRFRQRAKRGWRAAAAMRSTGWSRSFIGAGGRSVIAKPLACARRFRRDQAPDRRAVHRQSGNEHRRRLWGTQMRLMDDKQTSHPRLLGGLRDHRRRWAGAAAQRHRDRAASRGDCRPRRPLIR